MKKLALTLTALLALGLAGCGNTANSSPTITQPAGSSIVPGNGGPNASSASQSAGPGQSTGAGGGGASALP